MVVAASVPLGPTSATVGARNVSEDVSGDGPTAGAANVGLDSWIDPSAAVPAAGSSLPAPASSLFETTSPLRATGRPIAATTGAEPGRVVGISAAVGNPGSGELEAGPESLTGDTASVTGSRMARGPATAGDSAFGTGLTTAAMGSAIAGGRTSTFRTGAIGSLTAGGSRSRTGAIGSLTAGGSRSRTGAIGSLTAGGSRSRTGAIGSLTAGGRRS